MKIYQSFNPLYTTTQNLNYRSPSFPHHKPEVDKVLFSSINQNRHINEAGGLGDARCYSSFLRDPEFLNELPQVLKRLFLEQEPSISSPIPIKYYGICHGAQYYALAMLLQKQLGKEAERFQLEGSDIVESIISIAKTGILPLNPEELERYQHYIGTPANGQLHLEKAEDQEAAKKLYLYERRNGQILIPDLEHPQQEYYAVKGNDKNTLSDNIAPKNLFDAAQEDHSQYQIPEIWLTRNIWNHIQNKARRKELAENIAKHLPLNSIIILGQQDIKTNLGNKLNIDNLFKRTGNCFESVALWEEGDIRNRFILKKVRPYTESRTNAFK